jgi:tyrosinase
MLKAKSGLTRRDFLGTTLAAAGAATLPFGGAFAQSKAKYTRYNVTSAGGKKALASYAKGVKAMLSLPAEHPQNWFRNAFVHLMDCPHGNWWFYVWHRGYIGYFEETIRNLSGDDTFALPYWDWTSLPQIPDAMFDSPLTPTSQAFEPYTRNLAVFTSFIQGPVQTYWNGLNKAQHDQLDTRGYKDFKLMWNDVTGFGPVPCGDKCQPPPPPPQGFSANVAYANTCGSRYLTRDNPMFDKGTAVDVSAFIVISGLLPTAFYNPNLTVPGQGSTPLAPLSFNSTKTRSHNTPPGGKGAFFSVLEGMPHNNVHNYIGGVGPLDPGPYGNMTNFLSPVDPIFFLHHANMDRLWDIWTRKQKLLGLPYLPAGQDLKTFSDELFLFYVNGSGKPVGDSKAGEYISTDRFNYDYEPGGFGEVILQPTVSALKAQKPMSPVHGLVKGSTGSALVPSGAIQNHLATAQGASLVAQVTLPHSSGRSFDVFVGAPAGAKLDADSPYFAGTVAFFGNMTHMSGMPSDVTFNVPLPKAPEAFRALGAAASTSVSVQIQPSYGHGGKAPMLKGLSIRPL